MQLPTLAPPRTLTGAQASEDSRTPARLRGIVLSGASRLLRFGAVGAVCSLVQLGLLAGLEALGVAAIPANLLAYLLSAQVNFVLSNRVIWSDRWSPSVSPRCLLRRWLGFHASIAVTLVLNEALFIAARTRMADLPASVLAIAVTGLCNFVIQDRLTFRRPRADSKNAA